MTGGQVGELPQRTGRRLFTALFPDPALRAALDAARQPWRGARALRPRPERLHLRACSRSLRRHADTFAGLGCKTQTAAIAVLLRGFATPQTARKGAGPAGWAAIGRFLRAALAWVDTHAAPQRYELIPIAVQRDAVKIMNTMGWTPPPVTASTCQSGER